MADIVTLYGKYQVNLITSLSSRPQPFNWSYMDAGVTNMADLVYQTTSLVKYVNHLTLLLCVNGNICDRYDTVPRNPYSWRLDSLHSLSDM